MKFRKRIKILPGIHVNVSKSGLSLSVGGNGVSVSSGKKGTFLNTSIPGTGIYERQKFDLKGGSEQPLTVDETIYQLDEQDPMFKEIILLFMKHEELTIEDIKTKLFLGTNRTTRQVSKAIERGFLDGELNSKMRLKNLDEIEPLMTKYGIQK